MKIGSIEILSRFMVRSYARLLESRKSNSRGNSIRAKIHVLRVKRSRPAFPYRRCNVFSLVKFCTRGWIDVDYDTRII